MADWIKMRSSLLTNPKVIRMARVLLDNREFLEWLCPGCDVPVTRDETVTKRHVPVVTRVVVGALLPTWSAVNDTAARDGIIRHATSRDIDETAGVPGFGSALMAVDWLEELPDGEGVRFVNFEEHNSPQKERTLTAKTGAERSREYRERKAAEKAASQSRDEKRDVPRDVTSDVTRDGREEKKRREKKKSPLTPQGGARRFEEFWLAWPKGERKQDRAACEEKWRRSSLDDVADRILADIRVKRGTEKWRDGFIEAPLVYLNRRRWEDGVEPAGASRAADWTEAAT